MPTQTIGEDGVEIDNLNLYISKKASIGMPFFIEKGNSLLVIL